MPHALPAWPILGMVAGAAGTAAMSLAYVAVRRLRPRHTGQLDYDDSRVPGQIVARVMRLRDVTEEQEAQLGMALRWSYGSVFGILHGALRRNLGEPRATAAFGAALLTVMFTLFPLLGRTPPPWRWPADVLATSIGTHVAYVAGVAAVAAPHPQRAPVAS